MIALTPFHARYLVSLGIEPSRVTVRPTSARTRRPDTGRRPRRAVRRSARGAEGRRAAARRVAGAVPRRGDAARRRRRSAARPGRRGCRRATRPWCSTACSPPPLVAERVRAAAVVAIPSTWLEGLPRVLVEAFAHGRAVVATDLGGLGAAVPDDVGWRFAPEPAALAAVLDGLTRNGVRAKGAAARETYLARYAPSVTTDQLVDVYTHLAGSRG